MSKHEAGLKRIQKLTGKNPEQLLESFNKISPDFTNYIIEFAHGDLYSREGLDDKAKELAAVANLIGQGVTGLSLEFHINAMLNVGWTKGEIIELIICMTGYSGFPKAVAAMQTAQEVFDSHSIIVDRNEELVTTIHDDALNCVNS